MTEKTEVEARPKNVIEALAAVMRDMPGIRKSKHEGDQVTYPYRGIEEITAETQKLLGKYCVVFVPRVVERDVVQLTINSRPWTEEHLAIEYDVYGPGGVEDKIVVGPIHALGRDNSDKGCNKAMTQAFKYALTQPLCIGDSKDDGDKESAPADPKSERRQQNPARAGGGGRNEAPAKPPEPASPVGLYSDPNKETARLMLKTAVDQKWITSERANKIWWPHYGKVPHEQWIAELEHEISTAQEGELWSEQQTEPATITNLQERVASAQAAQRTRPAPGGAE